MHSGHSIDARDPVEQQRLKCIHVLDHDLELIISILAGDQQAFEHLRQRLNRLLEVPEALRRMLIHRNMDQSHQRIAKRLGIDQRTIPREDPGFFQRPYTAQTGRRRKPNAVGQILITDACVLLQRAQDHAIVSIKFHQIAPNQIYQQQNST